MTARTHLYLAYGRVLASTVALPELPAAPLSARVDLNVFARSDLVGCPNTTSAVAAKSVADERAAWLCVHRRRSGSYQLDFAGGARFVVSADTARVAVRSDCADVRAMRHLLIDQVVPLTLSHLGVPLLHASAVIIDGRAVAFVGPSGAGKSTLAASFVDDGVAVLADDALALEQSDDWWAWPSYPGVRVWPNTLPALGAVDRRQFTRTSRRRSRLRGPRRVASYTDKRRLGPRHGVRFCREPTRVARIYALTDERVVDPIVASLSLRDAVMTLVSQTFVLDGLAGRLLEAQLAWVSDLAGRVDVRRLHRPRDLGRLAEVRRAVYQDLTSDRSRSDGQALH